MNKIRGFEQLSCIKQSIKLPQRSTAKSACYDLNVFHPDLYRFMIFNNYTPDEAYEKLVLGHSLDPVEPDNNGIIVLPTGIKAYMPSDEVLMCYVRSSTGIKEGITLANGTAVIDSDYYNNPKNEGHIMIALRLPPRYNIINRRIMYDSISFDGPSIRVAQAMFIKFGIIDNDNATQERIGGIGSTNL